MTLSKINNPEGCLIQLYSTYFSNKKKLEPLDPFLPHSAVHCTLICTTGSVFKDKIYFLPLLVLSINRLPLSLCQALNSSSHDSPRVTLRRCNRKNKFLSCVIITLFYCLKKSQCIMLWYGDHTYRQLVKNIKKER